MKNRLWIIGSVILGLASQIAIAQAPAGSTGQCKDGTYTSAAKKAGACSGHKGVQTWFANGSASPAAPASSPSPKGTAPASSQPRNTTPAMTTAPTPARTAQAAPTSTSSASPAPAPGGGPGMVWVNIPTKVYHCAGTRFYGTTKNGKYMAEADAVGMGARPDHGKSCTK
jgi:hypothetical protein